MSLVAAGVSCLCACGAETTQQALDTTPTVVVTSGSATAASGSPFSASPSSDPSTPTIEETMDGPVTEPAPAPPVGLGQEFVAFARGGPAPPFGDPVVLLIQGTETSAIDAGDVLERRRWEGCPPHWPVSPRCEVSVLDVVAADQHNGYPTSVTSGPPRGPCLIPEPAAQPPAFDTADEVLVLQPDSRMRACANNFAVRLAVKDGSIAGVDLVLADP